MKKIFLYAILLAVSFWVQCKDKDLECGNFKVGEALLMPESKQFTEQFVGKKLIFKDSAGTKAVFYAKTLFISKDAKNILRTRCISPNNFWVDWGDYVDVETRYITFDIGSPLSSFPQSLFYDVFTISEGLPPDTTHYDIAILSGIRGTVLCPLSKRGVSSRKDLDVGNRYIGDTTLLDKTFMGVYKNFYDAYINRSFRTIKSLNVSTIPVIDDIYFTTKQGIIAFKIKGERLWVLDSIE